MRKQLRVARRLAGLTQEELATKAGIDRAYYNLIENGHRTPSLPVAMKIAEILGLEVTTLFLPSNVSDGDEFAAELRPEG